MCARFGKCVGGEIVKIGWALAALSDILKGEDNIGAIGAESGVTVTTVAFERSHLFEFVCGAIVEHKVAITAVTFVVVDDKRGWKISAIRNMLPAAQ